MFKTVVCLIQFLKSHDDVVTIFLRFSCFSKIPQLSKAFIGQQQQSMDFLIYLIIQSGCKPHGISFRWGGRINRILLMWTLSDDKLHPSGGINPYFVKECH